jgi:hypothetical protein
VSNAPLSQFTDDLWMDIEISEKQNQIEVDFKFDDTEVCSELEKLYVSKSTQDPLDEMRREIIK